MNILIIGGGFEQVPLIEKAEALGLKTIVVDINEKAPGFLIADKAYAVSTTDEKRCINIAQQHKVNAVVTNASDSATITVAKVCAALGLPSISVETAESAADKYVMKQKFERHGIPVARYKLVSNKDEAHKAAQQLGFPCVIKPRDASASKGVLRIETYDEIPNAFNCAMSFTHKKNCLVEEFIEGIEMSADSLTWKGHTEVLAISNKEKEIESKNNVATCIVYPPRFDTKEVDSAKEIIKKCTKALGIENGCSHIELMRRGEKDFVVLEMAARGGGFWTFSDIVKAVSGVDALEQMIQYALGEDMNIKTTQKNAAVLRFITANPGRIVSLGDPEEALKLQGVLRAGFFLNVGDTVRKLESDRDRAGYMLISAQTREDALKLSDKVKEILTIKTEAR